MHTGLKQMFPDTLEAVSSIMDPLKLRWIGFSHFESDESGALNEWHAVAPNSQAVASFVGVLVSLNDFAIRPPRILNDNEVLEIGNRRLRFLQTPHVPHCWDAGLFFEETDKTLLCSDLFFHPGQPEQLTEGDIVSPARDSILGNLSGPMSQDMPYTPYTDSILARLAALEPRTLAIMHGSSFRGDCRKAITELAAVIKENLSHPVTQSG
jgi:flavorubredoxin